MRVAALTDLFSCGSLNYRLFKTGEVGEVEMVEVAPAAGIIAVVSKW